MYLDLLSTVECHAVARPKTKTVHVLFYGNCHNASLDQVETNLYIAPSEPRTSPRRAPMKPPRHISSLGLTAFNSSARIFRICAGIRSVNDGMSTLPPTMRGVNRCCIFISTRAKLALETGFVKATGSVKRKLVIILSFLHATNKVSIRAVNTRQHLSS
jgi:hypothetical protein